LICVAHTPDAVETMPHSARFRHHEAIEHPVGEHSGLGTASGHRQPDFGARAVEVLTLMTKTNLSVGVVK
jgi:hypothetical protein